MTAPSLCLNFRALGRPFLWAAYFWPSVPRGTRNECGSFAPVLFLFALHGRCRRVLHLEPIGRAAGAVGGVIALRHDGFESHLAGVGENGRAVALERSEGALGGGKNRAARIRFFCRARRTVGLEPEVGKAGADIYEPASVQPTSVFSYAGKPTAQP